MGAGVMGSGIAQVAVQAGYKVTMMDVKAEIINGALASIKKSLDRKIKKDSIQVQFPYRAPGTLRSGRRRC